MPQLRIHPRLAEDRGILLYFDKFEGSAEEAKVAMFLSQLGIKYSKITKDEFVALMKILRKSDYLKSPGSKRGCLFFSRSMIAYQSRNGFLLSKVFGLQKVARFFFLDF